MINRLKQNINLNISWLPYILFFATVFIYFAFFGDYIFYYQEKSSLFIFSLDFLFENLHQPGGLMIWLGKFFTTFYYIPLAGVILISVFLTMVMVQASAIINHITLKKNSLIPFIIGSILFFLQTDYHFLLFNTLGFLLELAFIMIALKFRTLIKGWLPVILVPLCFYLTGGFLWIFLLGLTFYPRSYKYGNGWIIIVALWLAAVLTFWLSNVFIFFQSGKTLITFPYSDLNSRSQSILFLLVSIVISVLPLLSEIKIWLPWKSLRYDLIINLFASSILVIVIIIIGMERFDKKTKEFFYVQKLFNENKFNEVITYNTLHPTVNVLTLFLNNISLCETDRLDDLLFHFPQSPDGNTLFLKWEMTSEILNRGGYFYYTIGMINEAHRWAFENMVMKGLTPEDLKMLIKTELINGNYIVASKYITLLKKTAFYNKEARAFEKLLFNDVAINIDPDLGVKRLNKIETDFFSITDDPYINIERILVNDSLNKKAFEYKLAFMLLKKNYPGIAKELPKFESYGFKKFPVHIEEAIVALSVMNKGKLPIPGNLKISNDTETRWNQYLTVFQQYGTNPKAAEPALRKQFGNTFWYWAFYR